MQGFGHERGCAGQRRPARLQFEQRARGFHLGALEAPVRRGIQLCDHGVRQLGGQRHAAAVPARHRCAFAAGTAHIGSHVLHAHQFQQPAGEQEVVARAQSRDEPFLDRPQRTATGSAPPAHVHGGIADNGADAHAMTPCEPRIGHAPDTVLIGGDAVVVRIRRERVAALAYEVERPLPFVIAQIAVSPCAAHFLKQRIGHEAAAQRHCHQVLDEHVQWLVRRRAGFDMAGHGRRARGSSLHEFQAMRGYHGHARMPARRMARSSCPLQQPRYALGGADLQHAFNGEEIHAQVQARCAEHGLEQTLLEPGLDPVPRRTIQ